MASDATTLDVIADAFGAREVLVVTGAGISLASGVPTFRGSDPGAVWAKSVTEMGTRAYFEQDPALSWRWYLDRFRVLEGKEPNAGHRALVEIEEQRTRAGQGFLLVTQNVDSLHEKAGAKQLIKVHGSADRARCSGRDCENAAPRGSLSMAAIDADAFLANPGAPAPRCPVCDAFLRPHVLWFDEMYTDHVDYQFERVSAAANRADVAVFIGTSFAVGITDIVLEACRGRANVFSIDPSARTPSSHVKTLAARAEEALPLLAARLR